MSDFNAVSDLIKSTLSDAHVEVIDLTGTRDHLGITVYSDHFQGKSLIEQHQVLMDILSEKLKAEIHAVKLKTLSLEKARAQGLLK
jgi:stress-induced morphogen